ncbi:hypothetical protein C1645_746002 [Glomus cerebriforme]|uniref:Uncharacterized protein n=1 Tax=Glomus cerebriforme TaxID=658196 RepID=A0A397SAE0_9GLOM|nr:hypothetical protein C1645_746002 [Glomus cerebriforme]
MAKYRNIDILDRINSLDIGSKCVYFLWFHITEENNTIGGKTFHENELTIFELKKLIWRELNGNEDGSNKANQWMLWKVEDLIEGGEKWKALEDIEDKLRTPESVVEFLAEQEGVKDDSRNHTYYAEMNLTFKEKEALKNEKGVSDKGFHPVFALQATPGDGKSFLFDELPPLKVKFKTDRQMSSEAQRFYNIQCEEMS